MTIRLKLLGGGIAISMLLVVVLTLAVYSFSSLSGGFSDVVEKSATGVENSRSTETSLGEADGSLSQTSGGMQAVADDIGKTNMHVKVLERKIKQISADLKELLSDTGAVVEELPAGVARDALEDVSDAVGDIEEIMRREALVSLTFTVGKMDEFTRNIGDQVDSMAQLSTELSKVKSLSSEVVSANQSIQTLSQEFSGDIGLSRNVISVVLIGGVLLCLAGVVMITRSIVGPLNHVIHAAETIADGDFSTEIVVKGRDEISQLLAAMSTMQDNLKHQIEEDRRIAVETGRIKQALDSAGANVMLADSDNNIIYANDAVASLMRSNQEDIRKDLPDFDAEKLIGSCFGQFHENPAHQRELLEELVDPRSERLEVGGLTFEVTTTPVYDVKQRRIGTVAEWNDLTQELAVQEEISNIVGAAMSGDLTQRVTGRGKDGFFLKLAEGINSLVQVAEGVLNDTMRVLGGMAGGDVSDRIQTEYQGSFGQLKSDVNGTAVKLTEVIGEIKLSAESVRRAADEIACGNTDLSNRSETQASSLQETASSMEEMTSTVKQNADSTRQANQLAAGARREAEAGGEVLDNAINAMSEINDSSSRIADIINVIDEIAFQTNLLALNAAVEAARAGEQGRGFAVVAAEVRNLAQRSATAAKEIGDLIQDSVGKVEDGTRLVNESGATLAKIVNSVKRVSDIIAEIASAGEEQTLGIEQVNIAIMQMDNMTQQNAALVEEQAAASESMGEEAGKMTELVSFFTIEGEDASSEVKVS